MSRRASAIAIGLTATVIAYIGLQANQQATIRSTRAFPADSAAAMLRARGLQLGYNLDYGGALGAFERAKAEDPGDPTAYRLAAGVAWTALLFEQGAVTVSDYLGQARETVPRTTPTVALDTAFHENLRQALSISERQLRDHPADPEAHYQVGAAYGFLASYAATVEGRVLGSLGPARRAYREHQRVLELDPRRKDAGLVVGLYSYAVADLSAPMRLLARVMGFGGDRQRGIRMVEEAASYPSLGRPSALFMLLLLYNREARYGDAMRIIGELQREFPRNRLLWLEAGSTALRANRPFDARFALEQGLARLSGDPRPRALGEEARWRYAYGAALVATKDVTSAERELSAALAGAQRDWVRGRIHQELGKLADLVGDRPRALDEYRLAGGLCREDHDSDCLKEVKTLMKARYR